MPIRDPAALSPPPSDPAAGPWAPLRRLSAWSFPRRFPIVQFPNPPLIVALLAGAAGGRLSGSAHAYATSIADLALTVWAYEELTRGANWFRRLLGLAFLVLLTVRVAHAVSA